LKPITLKRSIGKTKIINKKILKFKLSKNKFKKLNTKRAQMPFKIIVEVSNTPSNL
jgi:hypothetical protein